VTISLTNRALAEITGYNLPSVRKWVVAFLRRTASRPICGRSARTLDRRIVPSFPWRGFGVSVRPGDTRSSDRALGDCPFSWKAEMDALGLYRGAGIRVAHRNPCRLQEKYPGRFWLYVKGCDLSEAQRFLGHFIEEYELIESGTHRGQFGPLHTLRIAADDFVRTCGNISARKIPRTFQAASRCSTKAKSDVFFFEREMR